MFDLSKPVQTRDGRRARIICTDCNDKNYPIVALVQFDHYEVVYQFKKDGSLGGNSNKGDLINVPVKHTGWINIYDDSRSRYEIIKIHPTKAEADQHSKRPDGSRHPHHVACIQIEFTEGEGI